MGRDPLGALLAREQWAFLGRSRAGWAEHLARIRAFLGDGLAAAQGPALILGAGSGLEVPWSQAPAGTAGWDADPWSRLRTFLRHGRWAPWVFEDLTGGMAALHATAWRCAHQPWSGRARGGATAWRRLAGLLPSVPADAAPLVRDLDRRRPATVLAANVMGQFGVVARRCVTRAFGGWAPWPEGGGGEDPLEAALDAWTARAVRAFLAALAASGADLWLVHDRGVLFDPGPASLGPWAEPWTAQLRAAGALEAEDPLCGVDVAAAFPGRRLQRQDRWLWPVAPGQVHVVEALRVLPG